MPQSLTYEKVLELITESSKRFNENLEKDREEFKNRLKKEANEREMSKKEFEARLKKEANEREKSKKEFDERMKKLDGKFGNILGSFVESMVEPGLINLFRKRGIPLREIHKNVIIFNEHNKKEAEIDVLLVNKDFSMAVEVKTTLTVEDVNTHIKRLNKLKQFPIRTIMNTTLYGAVAAIKMAEEADKYAYRKGLFVLKQKGELMEIANDDDFAPREWVIQ